MTKKAQVIFNTRMIIKESISDEDAESLSEDINNGFDELAEEIRQSAIDMMQDGLGGDIELDMYFDLESIDVVDE